VQFGDLRLFPISSPQPTSTSPTIQIRQPNAEDKMIADIVRLGVTVARKYPKQSAAFGFGFCLTALIDAARNILIRISKSKRYRQHYFGTSIRQPMMLGADQATTTKHWTTKRVAAYSDLRPVSGGIIQKRRLVFPMPY
jgi:hypothetical protein